jgi:hypothetical protein
VNPDKFLERDPDRPEKDRAKRDKRRIMKKSKAQEKRLAGKLGGRRQAGSGSGRTPTRGGGGRTSVRSGSKGDVDTTPLLIEAKNTDKGSMSIKKAWLAKIATEATLAMKTPALAISFSEVPIGTPQDWVAVPAEWLHALMKKAGMALS